MSARDELTALQAEINTGAAEQTERLQERERLIHAELEQGARQADIARSLGVSRETVSQIAKRR